jgi:hypothetical protein
MRGVEVHSPKEVLTTELAALVVVELDLVAEQMV